MWRGLVDCFGDEAYDVVGVVVELYILELVRMVWELESSTFISNKIHVFCNAGEAKYSKRSWNLGIGS